MKFGKITASMAMVFGSMAYSQTEYSLKQYDTISEVLVNKFHFSFIYGAGQPLQKILDYNNLTLEAAKKLPIGYTFRIHPDLLLFKVSDPLPPTVQEDVQVEVEVEAAAAPVPEVVTFGHSFKFGGGLYFYIGDLSTFGSFDASGTFIDARYRYEYSIGSWHFRPELQMQMSYFSGKEFSEWTPSYELGLSGLKKFNDYMLGPKVRVRQNYYLISNNDLTEDLINGIVPGVGVFGSFVQQNFSIDLQVGLNFASHIEGQDLASNPYYVLGGLMKFAHGWSAGPEISYEQRTLENFEQKLLLISLLLEKNF